MSREQYQTVKEVADLLKVSEVTVRRWIKEGELRAIDIGKGWRISPGDLDAFLKGHETCPEGGAAQGAEARAAGTKVQSTKG